MPINTVQNEWKQYRDAIYPKGISGVQNRECHQAFFAGAFVVSNLFDALAELPEDQAVAALAKLKREILEINQSIATAMRDRN